MDTSNYSLNLTARTGLFTPSCVPPFMPSVAVFYGVFMAHKPAFQFYPGDWLKDAALRICSPAARGVWMDLLCLLHECPKRGVFRIKSDSKMKRVSIRKLSKSIAGCRPQLIRELIDNGVLYVARKDGALYCKRLIRDELHRRHKARSGQKGGETSQANRKQTVQANPRSSSSSSASANKRVLTGKENAYALGWTNGERAEINRLRYLLIQDGWRPGTE